MSIEETYRFAKEYQDSDTDKLLLKSKNYPEVDMRRAVMQILSRRAVKEKLPTWYSNNEIRYPSKLSTEQCSSEITAKYKASLITGTTLSDLTGGLGVDCWAFSMKAKQVKYYERYEEYCSAAEHNFKALGCMNITIHNCDFRDIIDSINADTIYIDPARRGENSQRLFSLQEYEPNVVELKNILLDASSLLIIKVSPMADITAICQEIPEIFEIDIVSVKNECKELLLLAHKGIADDLKVVTLNFDGNREQRVEFMRSTEGELTNDYSKEIEEYLYEPNSSIMKSGYFKSISSIFGVKPIGRNSHLFTSRNRAENFPGRVFRIKRVIDFSSKWLKGAKKEFSKANIAVRNFPLSVAEIRKATKIGDGGDVYLFATTINPGKKVIIECCKE